ncbi:hypothetical protein CRG98_046500 [Punica granatum]|uniref:Protein kinase domain-containing protein n=1 Tax=Punica granatum TaxID=22663 RepID=A0A2I0HN12_PUNGR|nr:hypothetical protein CRG98_046500 [Punica granatum]
MDSALIEFQNEELLQLTNRFSTDQVLGNTQFGIVYRGKLESGNSTSPSADEIIIKVGRWPQLYTDYFWSGEWESARPAMKNEILVHEEIRSHPSVTKLIGYCDEDGHDVLIYNLKPLDSVQNLLPKGVTDFVLFLISC